MPPGALHPVVAQSGEPQTADRGNDPGLLDITGFKGYSDPLNHQVLGKSCWKKKWRKSGFRFDVGGLEGLKFLPLVGLLEKKLGI